MAGDSLPENRWRKVQLRLRTNQLDEANLLRDYDERCKALRREDHDYLRRLVLIGHAIVTANTGSMPLQIAISSNESNNTQKQHQHLLNDESQPAGGRGAGAAIRGMKGVFGNGEKP